MDRRGIGIFDSGLGGLTGAKVIAELLPREDLFFFGDSLRNPYGGRSREELCAFSEQNTRFLCSFGVKAILMACGTTSSNCLDYLRRRFDVPFFGVIDAACAAAAEATKNGRIGVIATEAAIRSGAYVACLSRLDASLTVIPLPCPSFAAMVERGHFREDDPIAKQAVARELSSLRGSGIDTLLLGCTHYPLLSGLIAAFLGEDITQVSAGAEAARALCAYLRENDLLTDAQGEGRRRYFTSGDPKLFADSAESFLGRPITTERHVIP